ncbi:DUF6056 family protein [Clostridium aciditolerans]|uniref:Uncharacterized protein n=1 Tax=Clostridium aciditolerans TaxID=339861 RepID=A0A934HZY1_9CLOT|nr:DUF6056 family protein [Clostridium aciditolerans]MBI6873602.1 hypothetical protein [Clostridium aciditolerans]
MIFKEKYKRYINLYIKFMMILIFILVCLCGVLQPIMADDYVYYNDVHNLGLLKYMNKYYFNWSGRVFSTFTIGIIMKNDFINNFIGILNGIVLILVIFLSLIIALKRKPKVFSEDRLTFLLIFCTAWFGMPVLAECFYWKTGAAFYSYPICLALIFTLPYVFYIKNFNCKYSKYKALFSIVMFLLGIIVGFSHEQIFVAIFFSSIVFYRHCFKKVKHKEIPLYLILGTIGFIIGGMILICAPGNFARMKTAEASALYKVAALGGYFLIYYFINGAQKLWIWIVTILLVVYIIKIQSPKKHLFTRNIKWCLFWIVVAFCSIAPMFVLASSVTARTCSSFIIFLCIALAALLNWDSDTLNKFNKSRLGIIVTVFLVNILFGDLLVGVANNYMLDNQLKKRDSYIVTQKSKGIKDIEVAPFDIYPHVATYIYDIKIDPNHWTNISVKDYYNINSIKINYSLQKHEVEESLDIVESIKHYWENKFKKK